MKKNLMTGMAALIFCGVFTSCSHDMDDSRQALEKQIYDTYEQAFISRFGTPAANQQWGFGATENKARTRAAVTNPTVTEAGYTFNAQMNIIADNLGDVIWNHGGDLEQFHFMDSYQSWLNSKWYDKYYIVNGSVVFSYYSDEYLKHVYDEILKEIPEGNNNVEKVKNWDYWITTKGGPVTLTPIYHNSNSGDMISYYYYPKGSNPSVEDIKKMPKYTLGNMANPEECNNDNTSFYHKTFSLVYVDGNGNVSYDFPKDYEIHFLIANTWVGRGNLEVYDAGGWNGEWWTITKKNVANLPEYYGDGRLNTAIHQSGIDYWNSVQLATPETSHIAIFTIGEKNYIGFEDWTDLDYNDVIFEVSGTDGGEEIEVEDDWEELRVIAEDLTVDESTDFDFNDVVFDVRLYTQGSKTGTVEVILRAAGGTLPLYVDGHEVHEAFGAEVFEMVNTNAQSKGLSAKKANPVTISIPSDHYSGTAIGEIANSIEVYVIKNNLKCILTAPEGKIASKIGVRCDYDWCEEREDLDHKYHLDGATPSLFKDYVQGILPAEGWYRYAKESIDEYKAAKKGN